MIDFRDRLGEMSHHSPLGRVVGEWDLSGEHLIKDHADSVEVRCVTELFASDLFRAHVLRSPKDRPLKREGLVDRL